MPETDAETWTTVRARLAVMKRHHPEANTDHLRRDLRADRLAAHIRKVVDQAPPLTPEQRADLARLFAPVRKSASELRANRTASTP